MIKFYKRKKVNKKKKRQSLKELLKNPSILNLIFRIVELIMKLIDRL
jgi:hypothetical protein